MLKFAVTTFPGSNCDHDAEYVLGTVLGQHVDVVWHDARSLKGYDVVVVPGGFAHGDYLRTGAIARFSPVMDAIINHANAGKPVIGICNGFQILCESGLLPGVLTQNLGLTFICEHVHIKVETTKTSFTNRCFPGQVLRMPIAHGEGRYTADARVLKELERAGHVVFRYCDADGAVTPDANPNGAMNGIAGICNARGNVVGLMPHPERASEDVLGSADGRVIFESVIASLGSPALARH
jgi:phosphoribosylformylglycinamidine synthase